jgi:hypothetical protein
VKLKRKKPRAGTEIRALVENARGILRKLIHTTRDPTNKIDLEAALEDLNEIFPP